MAITVSLQTRLKIWSLYLYSVSMGCMIVILTLYHNPKFSLIRNAVTESNFIQNEDKFELLNITQTDYILFDDCISWIISNNIKKDTIKTCSLSTTSYYFFRSKLGNGFGGTVFLLKLNISSSKYYVMKYNNGENDKNGTDLHMYKEFKAMSVMTHIQSKQRIKFKFVPKIYQYITYSIQNITKSFILMDYIANTIDILHKQSKQFFQNQPNVTALLFWINSCFINNLLQTFKDMSVLGMFHRDFATSDRVHNLLWSKTSDHICYLIDFGSTFFMILEDVNSNIEYGLETPWSNYYLNHKEQRLNILNKNSNYKNNIQLLNDYASKDVQYQIMKICVDILLLSYPKIIKSSNNSHIHSELEWNYINKAVSLLTWGRTYSQKEKIRKWCKYNMIHMLLSKSIFLKHQLTHLTSNIEWRVFDILNISGSFSICNDVEL
eukprot:172062_1